MPSPVVIAILSIIPGLGFFVMKKPKTALSIWGWLFLCFAVYVIATNELIYRVAFQSALIIWLGQILFAFRDAKRLKGIQDGTIVAVSDSTDEDICYPPDLSFKEKQTFKAKEMIKRQTELGEQVNHAVLARIMPSAGSHMAYGAFAFANMRQFYVGDTSKGLILVELDWLAKPAEVTRLAKADIQYVIFKKGLINDKLIIVTNDQLGLSCSTHFMFREQTNAIACAFPDQEQ